MFSRIFFTTCIKHYIENSIQYSNDKYIKCYNGYVNSKERYECIKNKGNIFRIV